MVQNGRQVQRLEIVSKVLLRHQNLRTTQVYLGRVTDAEALRWMDILYG